MHPQSQMSVSPIQTESPEFYTETGSVVFPSTSDPKKQEQCGRINLSKVVHCKSKNKAVQMLPNKLVSIWAEYEERMRSKSKGEV